MPGSIAARVMGWQRRMGGIAGPLSASGEAANGDPVQVEMYISGSWVDITPYVMVRDDGGNISITSGMRDEGSATEQSTLQLLLDNRDGRWNPRNPVGAYYGFIGRNTPIRVSVPNLMGGKVYRFWGEVASWPLGWDPTGTDVFTELQATGIMRRLAQGPAPERSTVYNAITSPILPNLLAYWPCEDSGDVIEIASAVVNGSPMVFTGATPGLASSSLFTSSDPLPTFTGSSMKGGVIKYNDTTATQVRFLLYVPSVSLTDTKVLVRVQQATDITLSPLSHFELYYNDTTKSVSLRYMDGSGANFGVDIDHTEDIRDKPMLVSLEFQEVGANTTYTVRTLDILKDVEVATSQTRNTETLTRCVSVEAFVPSISAVNPNTSTGLTDGVIGHITVENAITAISSLDVRFNTVGETAGRRIQRICDEENIAFNAVGDLDDTVAMAGQPRQNPFSVMQEAEETDSGMLFENRSVMGLVYRTRNALTNQDPQLVLDYAAFNLAEVPIPVEDDRYIQNRVTITAGESSATYSLDDGSALSTEIPPAGVGVYGTDVSLNLLDTDKPNLRDHAAWRVRLGTVDEARHPQISVNLAHSSFTNNPALKRAVLGLQQGDRIQVTNPPGWLPPDAINQIVLGFEETITHFEHRISLICAPASPYTSGILNTDAARGDATDSELTDNIDTTETSIDVAPSSNYADLWTTSAADFPFGVRVGGEVMTVTNITDWLSDAFGRSVSNGWGTSDTGQSWSTGGGTAADYAVGTGFGSHTLATTNASRRTFVDTEFINFDYYVSVTTSATATGGSLFGGPTGRYIDSSNLYQARLEFTTANTLILSIRKFVNANETQLGTYTLPDTYVAGTYYRIRFQTNGATLRAKAWDASVVETPEWQVSVTDLSITVADFIGTRSISSSANTNVNPQVRYDDLRVVNPQTFTVTRSTNNVTKSHSAGADVRLAEPSYFSL